MSGADTGWTPSIDRRDGPLYIAIAEAIAADIATGRLGDGARLPPQRALADRLAIDFTTVSRAYAEAGRRGLIRSRVGQGTFVTAAASDAPEGLTGRAVDMSMNLPPFFETGELSQRLWRGLAALDPSGGLDLLLRYQEPGGGPADRAAGATWLAGRFGTLPRERVLVCPGAQAAVLSVISTLASPGDAILTEQMAYPGIRALASQFGLRLVGVPMDAQGLDPDALDVACKHEAPKAIYCTPTLQNPTTATMSIARRMAVAEIARRHGVPIIEDDAYGALPRTPLTPIAAYAPEMSYYVSGLAKSLSPSLRIAYLVVPDARAANRIASALRAASGMASPLAAAAATRWIADGTAEAVLAAIREETAARRALATRYLPEAVAQSPEESYHLWLRLEPPWTRGEFASRLQAEGIGVVMSDAFALTRPPEAVRLGLGAARTRGELAFGLRLMGEVLERSPLLSSRVV